MVGEKMKIYAKPNSLRPPHLDPIPYHSVGYCVKVCQNRSDKKCSECLRFSLFVPVKGESNEKEQK